VNLVRKLCLFTIDLFRVNLRYLTDGGQRNRMREVLKPGGMTKGQRRIAEAERTAACKPAQPYADLVSTSLTLAGLRIRESEQMLNLLVGEIRPDDLFAGIRTAITVGIALAKLMRIDLRIVMLDFLSPGNSPDAVRRYIAAEFGLEHVDVISRAQIPRVAFGSTDLWLATHWKTAHAVQVACHATLIDPSRVVYLIQDYEPGFSPWSTEFVTAAATYHAGFVPVVNSLPLARFLAEHEDLDIPPDLVVEPNFDLARLERVAQARRAGAPPRILFYARPSKHRNLFRLGVSALRAAVDVLGSEADGIEFCSAGERHEDIQLGRGIQLNCLGRLPWDDYFDYLAGTQVLLSLQESPHPSHPPFDAAISGGLAITNEFFGTRGGLHPRISAVPATTESLAEALVTAVRGLDVAAVSAYSPLADGALGKPLGVALTAAVARLKTD
jgi:hypothetical protein